MDDFDEAVQYGLEKHKMMERYDGNSIKAEYITEKTAISTVPKLDPEELKAINEAAERLDMEIRNHPNYMSPASTSFMEIGNCFNNGDAGITNSSIIP
jgi:hypothetical protein